MANFGGSLTGGGLFGLDMRTDENFSDDLYRLYDPNHGYTDNDAHAHLVSALQEEIARQEAAFPDVFAEVDDTNMMLQMGTPHSAELMDNISQLRSQGFLVGMNPETLANKIESGDEAFSGYLKTALERWNPSYRGDDATINQYQDKIMAHDGYGGMGWLPLNLRRGMELLARMSRLRVVRFGISLMLARIT